MAFCTACGTETSGASFCGSCGAPQGSQTSASPASQQKLLSSEAAPNAKSVTSARKGNGRRSSGTSPWQWFVIAIQKYAVFDGRARRKEYWYFILFAYLIYFVLYFGAYVFVSPTAGYIAGALVSLLTILPALAAAVRRLHDTGRSGRFVLLCLVPLIGQVLLLIWLAQDSQPGSNQYGPNPKGAS